MFTTQAASKYAAALFGVVLVLAGCSNSATPAPSTSAPTASVFQSEAGKLTIDLVAAETMVDFEGSPRWAMTYNGTTPGPVLRLHPGDDLTINFTNDLSEPTNLHTHGLHVSPEGDGDNPFIMIEPGETHRYHYTIPTDQPAGTYWYHPHEHGRAAAQVAAGMSGAIIVEDSVDEMLKSLSTDNVLVVTDPPIVEENPWPYEGSSSGGMMGMNHNMGSGTDMMTSMMGRTGPYLLTNGIRGLSLGDAGAKLERVHIVNATASTRLQLTFTGKSMLQLATSGGRYESAVIVKTVVLSPGERTELILIPSASGDALQAVRLSNESSGQAYTEPETLAVVGNASPDASVLPKTLSQPIENLFASNDDVVKTRTISLDGHMMPTIDGKYFDPNMVNFVAKQGTIEEWKIVNNTPMFHPIHVHAWPFQIKGVEGWQDIVNVPPGQTMTIRVTFARFGGTSVLHCHILDHEDIGMMAIIKVV